MLKIFTIYQKMATILAAIYDGIKNNVELPKYSVIENHAAIEIRDYSPIIVAETEVSGERKTAINKGFRIIADYIFGSNISSQKVSMTAPVIQQAYEKISMTAPVIQEGGNNLSWKVQFIMPSKYTMATLPKPKSDLVILKEIPLKRYVVIQFSGLSSQDLLEIKQKKLESFIAERHLTSIAKPIYAFYNPPWTLPFLRRNEVMIEIKK